MTTVATRACGALAGRRQRSARRIVNAIIGEISAGTIPVWPLIVGANPVTAGSVPVMRLIRRPFQTIVGIIVSAGLYVAGTIAAGFPDYAALVRARRRGRRRRMIIFRNLNLNAIRRSADGICAGNPIRTAIAANLSAVSISAGVTFSGSPVS